MAKVNRRNEHEKINIHCQMMQTAPPSKNNQSNKQTKQK